MLLDPAMMLSIALACGNGVDARLLDAIAVTESGRETAIAHVNRNGTRDIGLMQINERNLGRLGLTEVTAFDPCRSVDAASRLLIADAGGREALTPPAVDRLLAAISAYNTGSPDGGLANGYVARVLGALGARPATAPAQQKAPPELKPAAMKAAEVKLPCGADPVDTWAAASCEQEDWK